MTTQQHQVAVIGAGPAGLRAAITAAKAGLTTLLIDDQPAIGGQFIAALSKTRLRHLLILAKLFCWTAIIGNIFTFDGVYWSQSAVWQIT